MKPFPPGFRVLSGDAAARAFDPNTLTWGNRTYGPTPISNRVSFACLDSSGPMPETPGLNVTSCDQGLRAQVHFQSCWDGVNLYKSDQSHVAYLSGMDNGVCPPGYPVLLPHIFLEIIYFPNTVAKNDGGMFVFSQGDTTGYGFHGDFLNGWDPQVQEAAIKQCMGANATNNGAIGACPPLAASEDPYFNQNCPEQPAVINEKVHGLISVLPGCNPPTGGPQRASQNICPVQPTVNNVDNQDYKNRSVAAVGDKVGTWQYMGCALDNSTPRPLVGSSYYDNTNMTIESCTAFCKKNGYAMAGMEASTQCFCGNAQNQLLQDPLTCASKNYYVCSGNLFEYCGGQQLMQIWNDTTYSGPSLKGLPVAGQSRLPLLDGSTATYQGCFVEGVGAKALPGAKYSNSTGMSLENCAAFCQKGQYTLFGTEYAQGMSFCPCFGLFRYYRRIISDTDISRMLLRQHHLDVSSPPKQLFRHLHRRQHRILWRQLTYLRLGVIQLRSTYNNRGHIVRQYHTHSTAASDRHNIPELRQRDLAQPRAQRELHFRV